MKYAGIDIAKRVHWMAVADAEGRTVMAPRPYANDSEGLGRMVADLDALGGDVAVAMESTGHYWRSCWRALSEGGYSVAVVNPVRTCAARKSSNLGRAKTDSVDCLVIADTLRKEGLSPMRPEDSRYSELRDLSRFQQSVSASVASVKLRLTALLDQVWPEFSRLFSDSFGSSAMAVLRVLGLPGSDCSESSLVIALRDASRNRFGVVKAREVMASAAFTCGIPVSDAHRLELDLLLAQLQLFSDQLFGLDVAMADLVDELAPTVCTVPGIGPRLAAQIVAEIGDPSRFPDARAVSAFAGLDPARFQSGGFEGSARISKRGSSYLRRALYLAASANLRSDNAFRDFYDRLRDRGRSHRSACCAVARKILCVTWAVMLSDEDYDPGYRASARQS